MILLEESHYHKAIGPVKDMTINNLFALTVASKQIKGHIYVDNIDAPSTLYIQHPYGMTLLLGNCTNEDFNNKFLSHALNEPKVRDKHEWMQAYPNNWHSKLAHLFQGRMIESKSTENKVGKVELNTRVNFKFNQTKFTELNYKALEPTCKIKKVDDAIFAQMKGSVVPMYFWNDSEHFLRNGVGFSVLYEGKLASTAYSAYVHEDKLELGIETIEAFRGKGLAFHACVALIDHCLYHGYEPVWSCRLENTASYLLAIKLGFEPILETPYYRLCN
jgi:hypothetical protein